MWELDVQLLEETFLYVVWFKEAKEEGLCTESQAAIFAGSILSLVAGRKRAFAL